MDAQGNDDLANAGKKIILAPSMYYSPSWYKELMQDVMTIVREYGKPDYFITVTTNPQWPEIKNSLFAGETASDRPDLCARVLELQECVNVSVCQPPSETHRECVSPTAIVLDLCGYV